MKHATKFARRSLAGLLSLVMLLAAFPVSVFAAKQSVDDILAELRDYDALYDKTGIVASYDFSDLKAGTAFPTGDTVQLQNGLTLEVLDETKKVDGTNKYVRTYEEGYLSFSANNRLVLSGLNGDAYTVTVDYAYNQYNATPVNYMAVEGTYGTDWVGSRWREVFAMGGLNVSASHMTAAEKEALVAQVKEYQNLVAEYEKYDPSIDNSHKDNQINFLEKCTFTLANGLTFGDVYYLLHEDLAMPNGSLGTDERFDAKYYEYLEYDVNFYEQWKVSGVAAGSLALNGAKATVTDNMPTAQSVLSAPYGERLSFAMAYDAEDGTSAVWSNGVNATLSSEGASGIASLGNVILLSDVAADVYAIYVYEGVVSDTQIKQNHFADIAKYYGLNIFSFLRLPEEGKAQVYQAFAGVSVSALTQKEAQALLDGAIENLGALSFDYESLYVKDTDGDGVSNLLLDWNAFDKSMEDNGADGYVASTTLVDKNGVTFTVPAQSSWGDQKLILCSDGSKIVSSISFDHIVDSVKYGDYTVTDDFTLDFMMAHLEAEKGFASGKWTVGPYETNFNYSYSASNVPLDDSYGPVSGGYSSESGWGTDNAWSGKPNPVYFGAPYSVPFHAGIYVDTEATTFTAGYYRDGAPATSPDGSKTHFGTKTMSYGVYSDGKVKDAKVMTSVTTFYRMNVAVYAIRIYDDVLESGEAMQNVFADFCSMFRVNMTAYTLLPEDAQKAVRAAVAALDISGIDSKESAQTVFDGIIGNLPASLRYDYSFLYDHDVDGDGDEDELLFDWDAFGKTSLDNGDNGKVASTTLTDNLGNSFVISKNAEWGDGYLYNAGASIDLKAYYPVTTVKEGGTTTYYHGDVYTDFMVAHTERFPHADPIREAGEFYNAQGVLQTNNASGGMYIGGTSFSMSSAYIPTSTNKDHYPHDPDGDGKYGPISGSYWAGEGWGTDSWWSPAQFVSNYAYKTFRFGAYVNTTNDQENGTGTYNLTYYRDGAVLMGKEKDPEKPFGPSGEMSYNTANVPRLDLGSNLGLRYYFMRVYTMPVPEEMSAKNLFADKMRFYGLDPISYISGSEEQRKLVHELLDNENIGDTQIETIRGKYEAIYAEESDLTVEDLYAQDRLVFSFDAFNLDEDTDATTLVDKLGTAIEMPAGANWKIENGALVLGDRTNGAMTIKNILANGAYTVQILMAYRSGAENGYNHGTGDIERDTFRLGGVTVGNVMNADASHIVQSSPIKMNGATVGKADGFIDLDTYTGSLLSGNAGEVFEFTTVVNASTTKAAPAFYRNGELVLSLDAANYTASKDVVIGDYADLAIYAIRIYGTRLGADAMAKNHFADLMKYYGVDMTVFNMLTQVRRDQLIADYADVSLDETSYLDLTQSLADALAAQLAPEFALDTLIGFDGYAVRLWGGTGVRAHFTLDRAKLDVLSMISEIGILHTTGSLPYLTDESTEKTIVYNADGYASNVGADGGVTLEIAFTDLTSERMREDHYFRPYAVLTSEDGREVTVYGDMSSELFGESVSLTELMARFNEHGTVEGGGLSPMAVYAGSDAYIAYINTLYNEILTLEAQAIGDASYAKALLLSAETALRNALAIKEGNAPANNAANESNVKAFAATAEKAALEALRQAERDAALLLADAEGTLNVLREASSVLAAAVDYGYAPKAKLAEIYTLLDRAEAIVASGITDEMTLIASSARRAAILAEKAQEDVMDQSYGANEYFKLLYVGSGDVTSLYNQMKLFADAEGYDDVILASLNFADTVGGKETASYHKLIGNKWFDVTAISLDKALADESWDAVILSPVASFATNLKTDEFVNVYSELAKAVRASNAQAKLYYAQGWAPSERQAVIALGDDAAHDGTDAKRIYDNLIAYAQALPATLFDGVLPTATLLENLRTSVYLEAIYNWKDGYALSDLGAYATAALLLSRMTDFTDAKMNRVVGGMDGVVENDWLRESINAAIKTPNAITESTIRVSSGIHEEDEDILRFTAMGASNISNGNMYSWILTYMATRNPNKKFVMLNEGVPGEGIMGQTDPNKGISGGLLRANFIVDAGADVVLIHYGVYNAMCNYFDRTQSVGQTATNATKQAKLDEHKKAMEQILTLYRDNGIDVIFSCEGYVIKPDHNWQTGGNMTINDAYAAVTQMYKDTMTEKNPDGTRKYPNVLGVVDTTTHFGNIVEENNIPKDQSGDEIIFNSDGLHISTVGGAVYADILFGEVLGSVTSSQSGVHEFASDIVSDVTIKANGTATAKNATVKNVNVSANGVSYKYLANAIPVPANADYLKANALASVNMTDINQEIIRVEGLASGQYAVNIDGVTLGTYTAEELAAGVNIAELDANPAQKQAQNVYNIVRDMVSANSTLNQFDYCNYVFYTLGYIDREYNFLYNEKEGRYYDESDLRAYIARGLHSGWYGERMTEYFNDSKPEDSTFATAATNQATVNKCTYLMQEAAKPIERTVEIVKQ